MSGGGGLAKYYEILPGGGGSKSQIFVLRNIWTAPKQKTPKNP